MTTKNMKDIQKSTMKLVQRLEIADDAKDGEMRRAVLLQLKEQLTKLVPLLPGNNRLPRVLKAVEDAASKELYDPADDDSFYQAVSATLEDNDVAVWCTVTTAMFVSFADMIRAHGALEVD